MLFAVISWYGEIWDLALEILHLAFEALHLVIEFCEETIEIILEHLLHTGHHQSEIIIVNSVLILIGFGLYRFYRTVPRFYRQARRNVCAAWLRYKRHKLLYWRSLSQAQKAILAAAYLIGGGLLLFWLTL